MNEKEYLRLEKITKMFKLFLVMLSFVAVVTIIDATFASEEFVYEDHENTEHDDHLADEEIIDAELEDDAYINDDYEVDGSEPDEIVEDSKDDEETTIIESEMLTDTIPNGMLGTAPWHLYEDGTMVVRSGVISGINFNNNHPWNEYRSIITTVVFDEGVSATGSLDLFLGGSIGFENLVSVQGAYNLNTANVNSMVGMFWNARSLESIDVSTWNTASVTSMQYMFFGAESLVSLDVSTTGLIWNTGRVTRMDGMFYGARSLTTLDVSGWDTGYVELMTAMFFDTRNLSTLDVSSWRTNRVTCMADMFTNASNLTNLNVSAWNTNYVTRFANMFNGASGLVSLDLSNWNTNNANSNGCRIFDGNILLPGNTHDCMISMFAGATSLRELTLGADFNILNPETIGLPDAPISTLHTGYWTNDAGVTNNFTALELMTYHYQNGTQETWVWASEEVPTIEPDEMPPFFPSPEPESEVAEPDSPLEPEEIPMLDEEDAIDDEEETPSAPMIPQTGMSESNLIYIGLLLLVKGVLWLWYKKKWHKKQLASEKF